MHSYMYNSNFSKHDIFSLMMTFNLGVFLQFSETRPGHVQSHRDNYIGQQNTVSLRMFFFEHTRHFFGWRGLAGVAGRRFGACTSFPRKRWSEVLAVASSTTRSAAIACLNHEEIDELV